MHHVHILNCPLNEILFSFHLTLRSRPVVRNKDKTKQEKQKQTSKTQHNKKISQLPQRASYSEKNYLSNFDFASHRKKIFRMDGKCA